MTGSICVPVIPQIQVFRYFRDLYNGTIITESEAQGDYVPFKRFLIRADTMDLCNITASAALVVTHWQAS